MTQAATKTPHLETAFERGARRRLHGVALDLWELAGDFGARRVLRDEWLGRYARENTREAGERRWVRLKARLRDPLVQEQLGDFFEVGPGGSQQQGHVRARPGCRKACARILDAGSKQ